ncbi:AI-2E family transporter [Paenibacillus lemnae]|uniref:AI-2E family transporter n=1 Tax=Paenibacillus lemnae TaxID=1330551 RepID=A0A848M837_PAELE|nr:AI-2E family transporter [Paenibacillus lemnae]NMO96786.1 AI-2E family transporter [Paenibacillus lemnae]
MLPLYKKYWRTAFDIGLIVLTVYLVMLAFSRLYNIAAPVFLSFIVFWMIEPIARFFHRRGLRKPFASALAVLIFLLIILGLLFGAGAIIVSQIMQLQNNLPVYTTMIQEQFESLTNFLQTKLAALPPDVSSNMNGYFKDITNFAKNAAQGFFLYIVGFMGSFTTFIANFGIAIILAFFLSTEIGSWRSIASEKTPKTIKSAVQFLKDHVFTKIGSYLKAQLKLISITFVLAYIGLLILGTGNALSIALICAVFDFLPLLGVPVIFIPWIIYLFVVGNTSLAVGLLILLAVIMVIRQLLEPKIAGQSIGVTSAFLMLSFMIISLSIFGIAGLIMTPILIILLKELLQQGYLQRWIRLPKEEFEVSPLEAKSQNNEPHHHTSS